MLASVETLDEDSEHSNTNGRSEKIDNEEDGSLNYLTLLIQLTVKTPFRLN